VEKDDGMGWQGHEWRGTAVLLTAVAMLAAHGPTRAETPGGELLSRALRAALNTPAVSCSDSRIDTRRLAPYYRRADSAPLWIDPRGPGRRARQLLVALQVADEHGLPSARYRLADIESHWHARDPAEQACLDLLLTDAFARYSLDLHSGRLDPREADTNWHLRPASFDPAAALLSAGEDGSFAQLLDELAPPHESYRRLREALRRYRLIAQHGGWRPLPAGPKLEPGDSLAQVALLRERLRAEGDLSGFSLANDDTYDETLAEAVRRFQRRHGLGADGIVGPRTRAALDVPVEARIAQIRRVLERWRWLPRDLGGHYILVNTASHELAVIENGRTVLRMRSINGTPDQATPSFTAVLRKLVINPYWYVPGRIERDKLWPRERHSPGYLASRGFRIFDTRDGNWRELDPSRLDWSRIDGDNSGLRLRQEPGPKNLMGRLSFAFPNPFDVFLHDTPDRALFERETRTFSEGCVRIENAMALALHALRRSPEWSEARIREEIDALHHLNLPLPEPIPVYVLYLTSWVDDEGLVHFHEDVYRRETVLAEYYPAAK
jgi:murein L,D-transpeptidase YcbB/YkuD